MDLRIGLTMRIVQAAGYIESRDALARDWTVFMRETLPEARWLPFPNLGERDEVIAFAEHWGVNALILTGGNSLFEEPLRDDTERHLLDHARWHGFPVLGVCRGMQMLCHHFGRSISSCPNSGVHIATTHTIRLAETPFTDHQGEVLLVNSYHEQCVGLPEEFEDSPLHPFALSDDGLVEGVLHNDEWMMGIMWHPERKSPSADFDGRLIRNFFRLKE